MTRPWKHPQSGIYWLRRAVPHDLRALIGRREEKKSLGTRDPAEARRRHAAAIAELEGRWANLRAGPKGLTEADAYALTAHFEDEWLKAHWDNPSEQTFWRVEVYERLWPSPDQLTREQLRLDYFDPNASAIASMEAWCLAKAAELSDHQGLLLDEKSRQRLARGVAAAVNRASVTLQAITRGRVRFSWPPEAQLTTAGTALSRSNDSSAVMLEDLIAGWVKEKRPAERTVYEWRRIARELTKFIGHQDAAKMTPEDLLRWKTSLIEAGLRPKTIRDAKLAAVRAILRWGVDNRLLAENVAEKVKVEVNRKPIEGKRGYRDDEAAVVLRAAAMAKDPVRRWVPWLCAYSGARLAEVCQLRKEDIRLIEGVWCMAFDPEAGSLKTRSSERVIPIHPAVLETGFLVFVEQSGPGPLFPTLEPDRFGRRGGTGTKILGRWVRSLGLTDVRVSPSHSWRHRFITQARRHQLAPDVTNAVTGHARKSVADSYGEFPIGVMLREISKIPMIQLAADAGECMSPAARLRDKDNAATT
jgi:integrase